MCHRLHNCGSDYKFPIIIGVINFVCNCSGTNKSRLHKLIAYNHEYFKQTIKGKRWTITIDVVCKPSMNLKSTTSTSPSRPYTRNSVFLNLPGDGHNFPAEVMLTARVIKCAQAPTPRDRCCLPQSKHFVCYNIK